MTKTQKKKLRLIDHHHRRFKTALGLGDLSAAHGEERQIVIIAKEGWVKRDDG